MFWIKWAFNNLIVNKKRTIGIITLIGVVLIIVIVDLMFLEGAKQQMVESIQNNRGDIDVKCRGENANLLPLLGELAQQKKQGLVETEIKIFKKQAQLIGNQEYSDGTVVGTEPVYFKYLNRNVSWLAKPDYALKEGTAIIEATLADKLNLNKGDNLTIQIHTDAGVVNTLQVIVDGIFIGSNIIYGNTLYINIKDQNQLYLQENYLNELRVYYRKNITDDKLITIMNELSHQFYKTALFESSRLDLMSDYVFQIFFYYRYLLIFLFFLLNTVFVIILYFAIQNLFFMMFRERRQEISTLLTYGMKSARIKLMVFWESIFIFLASFGFAAVLTTVVILMLRTVTITNPNIADLIIALGGPRLNFAMNFKVVLGMVGFLFVTTLYASYRGANAYLKMEIREIISLV